MLALVAYVFVEQMVRAAFTYYYNSEKKRRIKPEDHDKN